MPSSSLVGLSCPEMQCESEDSMGCMLIAGGDLKKKKKDETKNMNQGCQHLLSTYPAPDTAKHSM